MDFTTPPKLCTTKAQPLGDVVDEYLAGNIKLRTHSDPHTRRKQISADVAEYLANGGTITELPSVCTGPTL